MLYIRPFKLLLFWILATPMLAQSGDLPEDFQEGKCYAKPLIQDVYEVHEEEFPIYLGDEPEKIDLDTVEFFRAAHTKWVQRKTDQDCKSNNPKDCLVWCLVEIPEKVVQIVYMLDPSQSDLVDWEVHETKELVEKGGFSEWREVVCASHVTPEFVEQLQLALVEEGYYAEDAVIETEISTHLKAALTLYQRENGLPVGQLDLETLAILGF